MNTSYFLFSNFLNSFYPFAAKPDFLEKLMVLLSTYSTACYNFSKKSLGWGIRLHNF